MSTITNIDLGAIRADTSAQPRASISTSKIDEYVERMTEGDAFPPMVVFFDGQVYWLGDGFHRYHAAVGQGFSNFPCDVREGGLREAVLFSCGANAAHGLPRTNEDKRRAVMKLLQDTEWGKKSEVWIAEQCKVSRTLVRSLMASAPHLVEKQDRTADRTVTRGGATYIQNTANIGKRSQTDEAPASTTTPPDSPGYAQHKRDLENSFISAAIRDLERIISGLPAPEDAAGRFPHHHRHIITKATLFEMSEWLRRFAEAYTAPVPTDDPPHTITASGELRWEADTSIDDERPDYEAKTAFGAYVVSPSYFRPGGFVGYRAQFYREDDGIEEELGDRLGPNEAKSLAQHDYNRRQRAATDTTPPAITDTAPVREDDLDIPPSLDRRHEAPPILQ
jgi:hypothetical protein